MKNENLVCIGYEGVKTEFLKPEFRVNEDTINGIYFYKDTKKKTLKINIMSLRDSFFRFRNGFTKKVSIAITKSLRDPTPVDTSKWVKPDNESLRNILLKEIAFMLIMEDKPENFAYVKAKNRADLLYSILHSHSPRNPQTLTNFWYQQLDVILNELKDTKMLSKLNNIIFKNRQNLDERRLKYKTLHDKIIRRMVVKIKPFKSGGKR